MLSYMLNPGISDGDKMQDSSANTEEARLCLTNMIDEYV